jgi:hypothetical protein
MSRTIWVKNNGTWKPVNATARELWTTLSEKELAIISGEDIGEASSSATRRLVPKDAYTV